MAYVTLHRHLHKLMSYNPKLGQKILMKRDIFDCPTNREKLREKYLAIMTANTNNATMVEVFCIDHLPYHTVANCSSDTSLIVNRIFNEEDEDEDDDDDDADDDF